MQVNPKGEDDGDLRVACGGGWGFYEDKCCAAVRGKGMTFIKGGFLGFRVIMSVKCKR